jgi:uncharacterized protein (DUF1778 family)
MQTDTVKSLNLNIRISELSKNVLQRAAELEGDTLSHFVLSQALESAYKRLSETQVVSLNPQEQQQFFQLLENPPPINATFARAIERYKKIKENDLEI